MRLILLWGILIVGLGQTLSAQDIQVEQIVFTGLKKTKASHLRRFIDTQEQQPIDRELLQADLQNLANLNSVAKVNYRLDTLEGQITLTYEIEEALTLFPLINFGGIRGNFWYQAGFTDVNWGGRGIQVSTYYRNNDGGRHNFQLYTRVPFIRGSRWGSSVNIQHWASTEPLYFGDQTVFYDYDNSTFGLTGIFQRTRTHMIELGGTYFIEKYRKNARHDNELTPGPDDQELHKALGKFVNHVNHINDHFFYRSGFDNITNAQTVYTFADQSWFFIVLNDTRFFRRVGERGNLAARLRLGISSNNDTPFAPFVLDSYINIRGSGNRIDRGTGVAVLNAEYRHTVFDRPVLAGQVVAFSDAGTWRNPGGELNDLFEQENFRHFVGLGARLIYKKAFNAILRIDFGMDLYDSSQRGWVLGFGQYF